MHVLSCKLGALVPLPLNIASSFNLLNCLFSFFHFRWGEWKEGFLRNHHAINIIRSLLVLIVPLFQPVLFLWTKLSFWTPWTISYVLEPYLPSNVATRFLIGVYTAKNLKRTIRFDPYCPFATFHQSSIGNTAGPTLSSQGFFIYFHQKLVFYFCLKNFLKNLTPG